MGPKTVKDLVNYMGIYGRKTLSQIKNSKDAYDSYSYDDYQKNAKAIASYLDKVKHLKKEDMVAIYSENRPEWMMAYLGIVYNGVWAVPLDAKLSDLEVKNLVLDCGARTMFLSKSLYDNISSEPEIMKNIHEFIIFDDAPVKDKKVRTFQSVLEEGRKLELKDREVKEEDVASLIYTSGTTGTPKGVMLTHKNFSHQVSALSKAVDLNPEDTVLSLLPLHHTFEFSVELTCLYCGTAITYAESLKPNKMLANIKETGVTVMIGVPLIYEKLYEGIMRQIRSLPFPRKQLVLALYYLSSGLNKVTQNKAGKAIFRFLRKTAGLDTVRFMISGAAPLNFKVAKGFDVLGFTLLNGYGLTESSPVISVNPLYKKIKNESVGIVIEGMEVRIGASGGDANNVAGGLAGNGDGHGEILAKGPSVMKGYYKNPKATREVLDSDGWLHTGDIGMIDSDNYLHVTGRQKNIIVTPGGKNVYPEEIEEQLNTNPFILESLIIGVPESEHSKGENIYCYVVPNYEYFDTWGNLHNIKVTDEYVEKTVDQVVREISMKQPDYKRIKGWRIRREEFQKTSTKKIKRYLFSGKDFLNS